MMIETVVLNYLNSTLSVPCYMEIPADPPVTFVLIEKTGSSVENYIHSATFAVQSYAETLYKAAELNENVKTAMDNIIATEDVSKSELNNDYNFTDTANKKYRYQAVYDLVY